MHAFVVGIRARSGDDFLDGRAILLCFIDKEKNQNGDSHA